MSPRRQNWLRGRDRAAEDARFLTEAAAALKTQGEALDPYPR